MIAIRDIKDARSGQRPARRKAPSVPASLASLLAELRSHRRSLSESAMRTLLAGSSLTSNDLRDFVQFSSTCYTRNLIHAEAAYDLLVLCWRNGQRSPIHDHRGSNCALRVLQGIATEVTFHRSPCGLVSPSAMHELKAGEVTASRDDDMHQMGNLQARGDLITLHLYSPPLRQMGTYFLGDSVIGEHESPSEGMRVARLSVHIDRRTRLTEALRRTRSKIGQLAGATE